MTSASKRKGDRAELELADCSPIFSASRFAANSAQAVPTTPATSTASPTPSSRSRTGTTPCGPCGKNPRRGGATAQRRGHIRRDRRAARGWHVAIRPHPEQYATYVRNSIPTQPAPTKETP